MSSERRVIVLEFNELSPTLMDRFMAAGALPSFSRLHRESHVWVTEAFERAPDLNPWIQWVTVHTGLNHRDHGVAELDEGQRLAGRQLWDLASAARRSVWVCGSMSVGYRSPIDGWIVPDPWTTKVAPWPEALRPFFRFVQQNVLEHTSEKVPLDWADYPRFLRFMLAHGLSWESVAAIVRQLVAERGRPGIRWKRAMLLDTLQFDLFAWRYRKARPHFATFFSNCTAHYQHMYWRDMEPHLFSVPPARDAQASHERAILAGYRHMDRLVERCLALADAGTSVVLCTALSQQPCLIYEDAGGKVVYRPRSFDRLLDFAGVVGPYRVAPLMAEEFNVNFDGEAAAERAAQRLARLRVDGRPAMRVERRGALISTKCQIHETVSAGARLTCDDGALGFFDAFYLIEGMKSGMHHPDGIFWVRTPERTHVVHEDKAPLAAVAPTLLALLSLAPPEWMREAPLALDGAGSPAGRAGAPLAAGRDR
jgi:hypothetical protein